VRRREPVQQDRDVDVVVGVDPENELRRVVIDEVLSRGGPAVCARRSATDRTLRVQQLNALLGHDPDTWKHSVRAGPDGRKFKLRTTRNSRTEGQTKEPTRTAAIID
jgi:hypothetical protein